MRKLTKIFAVLAIVVMLLLSVAPIALADTAEWSVVDDNLVWGDGINGSFTHNTWYSADRHWIMYYEFDLATPGIKYTSTANYGASWQTHVIADTQDTGYLRGIAIWYHENTELIHYARLDIGNATNHEIRYRAGTPNADGTITWIAAEAIVEEGIGVGGVALALTIACDENGLPYIAWTEDEDDSGYYWTEVASSNVGNGTWTESEDTWEEFDSTGSAIYGHDYDVLFSGNWTAIAPNLVPISSEGDLMQLSWSIIDQGNLEAGIDSTIYNESTGWGNLTWAVPVDATHGLYPSVYACTAFSMYDMGAAVHMVYADVNGDIYYNARSQIQIWEDVNGWGNYTLLSDEIVLFGFPAIAGYDNAEAGEDLIVVYHDYTDIYYTIKPYSGSWTTPVSAWNLYDYYSPNGDAIFLHSLQYKYAGGSPVGFAWTAGGIEWEEELEVTGELFYWWVDADGAAEDEEGILGWYDGGGASPNTTMSMLIGIIALAILAMVVISVLKSENIGDTLKIVIIGLIAVAIVFAIRMVAV